MCSSTNGKKWEAELQTLKNNNARLTTALQESKGNVNKWKQQLTTYQEESTALKKKVGTIMSSDLHNSFHLIWARQQLTLLEIIICGNSRY